MKRTKQYIYIYRGFLGALARALAAQGLPGAALHAGRCQWLSWPGLAARPMCPNAVWPACEQCSRRSVKRAREQHLESLAGLHGPLLRDLMLEQEDGAGSVKVWYINPVAMLHHAWNHCKPFQAWVRERVAAQPPSYDRPWRLVLYSDEITPGNQLKQSNDRKVQAVYWTFAEIGRQGLGCEVMWFTLTSIRSKEVTRLGGMSVLWRFLIDTFFSTHSMREGLLLDSDTMMFADLGVMVSDEAALKASLASKGAAGTLMCAHCSNCVTRGLDAHDRHERLVKFTETDFSKFVPHTNESVTAIVQHLAAQKPLLGKVAFEKMEQCLGFNFEPRGLLNHPTLGHRMLETAPGQNQNEALLF